MGGLTSPIAVVGAGSWGTALAVHLAGPGRTVRLWARESELVKEMREKRHNPWFLPGVAFPSSLLPSGDMEETLRGAEMVLSVAPSHGTRSVMRMAAPFMEASATVISATKGLEVETLLRVSEVIAQEVGDSRSIVVLSGPSFAVEVTRQLPTAVSVASRDATVAERVQAEFRARYFRLYASTDVVGVEIGGALKNVIAIAAGVVEGLGLGHNALAGLITRGLAEITRLACALGGRRETLAGLSGLGDLVLTCTGVHSRNRLVGYELAKGRPLEEILGSMRMVAEGVKTTGAALALGMSCGVELPIAAQMTEVLAGRKDPRAAVEELMLRPQKSEV
jgi:glycerol-3-phosphate dehydrogenase (NAD(P)+)